MHPVLVHLGPILIPSYGVTAALGLVLALALVLRTARIVSVNPNRLWNLCIISLFVALVGSRLLLVIINWTVLRSHPAWLLQLAMIHHPLLAAIAASLAATAAILYGRTQSMPLWTTADAIAAPLALGLAFEQFGALLSGYGYGTETAVHWAIVYRSPFAAFWSGAPLGVPVHPVQIYAALAFLTIGLALLVWLPYRRQHGDIAGLWLLLTGAAIYFTEFWRDPEGRGSLHNGLIDGPQIAAVLMVITAAFILRERTRSRIVPAPSPSGEEAHD